MNVRNLLLMLLLGGAVWAAMSWWQGREVTLQADDPRLLTGDKGIVMLAAEWCGYCRQQRKDFELAGVLYRVLDVDTEEGSRAASALGTRGVPVTVVGQQVIEGYDTALLHRNLLPLGYRVY
ncbi:glutaredoxin family protein [Pseudoxanthomonas gei]|uniref:Glutaredoxin family protein n=1 Tax=Pseudoxanthomonas gei TaxID=1383030 RepID=A0ABX0AHG2_9GAMM|nr:glutaredoxin domain-containing protein [Pseudoxanthomonas gei]NDK39570.1 glutaredoxin family protein [Pseudoxanthomonas gei]